MARERYALLGLARARASWFRDVAQWTTAASIPADFTKCVSAEEVRASVRGTRPYSAVLLDGDLPAVDRDLLAEVREAGVAPFVVAGDGREWGALGAAAVLPPELDRSVLLDALSTHAVMVGDGEAPGPDAIGAARARVAPWAGQLVAVCGPGGTGASTVAMALAGGMARDERTVGQVVLADLCLRGDQAMLHDVGDVFPGIQELVEAHRGQQPSSREVRDVCFYLADRGYHLLLGLRRPRYWAALRPRAVDAALAGLRDAFDVVVADIDADVEGEDDAGSADVAERCHLARATVRAASLTLVVSQPTTKGLHALTRLLVELVDAGVAAERLVPVLVGAPRARRARTRLVDTLAGLAGPVVGEGLAAPVFLPHRKVDEALRDGVELPSPLPGLLAGVFHTRVGRAERTAPQRFSPVPVQPGELGSWSPDGQ